MGQLGVQADGDLLAGVGLTDRQLVATQADQPGGVDQPVALDRVRQPEPTSRRGGW